MFSATLKPMYTWLSDYVAKLLASNYQIKFFVTVQPMRTWLSDYAAKVESFCPRYR